MYTLFRGSGNTHDIVSNGGVENHNRSARDDANEGSREAVLWSWQEMNGHESNQARQHVAEDFDSTED